MTTDDENAAQTTRCFDGGALTLEARHHPEDDVLVLHWRGRASLAGMISGSDASYEHPSLTGSSCVIHVIEDLDFSGLSADDVRHIAAHPVRPAPPAGMRVVLVAPSDIGFGLARMLQVLADDGRPVHVGVHRTLADGLDWARAARS